MTESLSIICKPLINFSVLILTACVSIAHAQNKIDHTSPIENTTQVVKQFINPDKPLAIAARTFQFEPNLAPGEYTYIIELTEDAVAQAPNSLAQLRANRQNRTKLETTRSLTRQSVITQQRDKVASQQKQFLRQASAIVNSNKVLATYEFAVNGLAIRMTQQQAAMLSQSPMVSRISREKIHRLNTDRGPSLIGAPDVWSANNLPNQLPNQGEGVIVGIIDSGVNTDHPSFAEISGDGYVHTNPLGDGVFLGDCAGLFVELCNNKLIGVYSYPVITNVYSDTDVFPPNLPRNGEDYDGHGSHVASTAAGNILIDVAEVSPVFGEEESDGATTGFVFDRLSGVAPRANIISYQVCYPGNSDDNDTYASCVTSAILAAIDDAIADNVDVINFSISGGGNPWTDSTERAFLSANNAGIFAAVSVGNSGPATSTSEKQAPWYTSVAFSEHGRENQFAKTLTNFTGGSSTLATIQGQSNTGSYTAAIVYAGDFTNPNDPGNDPAQCLQPFPSGTFNGQIVVCDRGEIARVEKAENVAAGGAGGYVLANVDGGDTFLANDFYVVPGIHIDAESGNRLRTWLDSGTDHRASITQSESIQFIDEERVDVLASGSSRGPNESISTLVPTLTAPGVDIYAAFADQQFGRDGDRDPAASDFNYLTGSSMSSPHVAGAAALIKAANPSWTPDEIRSALSLTTTQTVKKEDGETPADFFDMGAGRIQVDKAVATGLIMNETNTNYLNANPTFGGDPRSLNLPSITDNECRVTCEWERTFTATTNATWTYSQEQISPGLSVNVFPTSFTLLAGQSQTVTFTILNEIIDTENYAFALAKFTSPGLPEVNVPISVLTSIGDIPRDVVINGTRDIDSLLLNDLELVDVNEFSATAFLPVKPIKVSGNIREDSNNDYSDSLTDGVSFTEVITPEDAIRLIVDINSSSAIDMDLYIVFDEDEDGTPELFEEVARSNAASSNESIIIDYPRAGSYFIAVHNFSGNNPTGDDFEMQYTVTTETFADGNLFTDAPSSINADEPFDLRIGYNLPDSEADDTYYAAVKLGSVDATTNLGFIHVEINRLADDVFIDATPVRIDAGDNATFNIKVANNPTNEQRSYEIVLPVPVGTEIVNFNSGFNAQFVNNEITWLVTQNAGNFNEINLNVELRTLEGVGAGPIDIRARSRLSNQSFSEFENTAPTTNIQIEGPPSISFNGEATGTVSATETRELLIPIQIDEPNNDQVTVSWIQTSGPATTINDSNGEFTLIAPRVDTNTQLTYDVTVIDPSGNQATSSLTVNVINNQTPTITSINFPANASGGQSINIIVSATDPENDALTVFVNNQQFTGTNANLRTPTTGESVTYNVLVTDGINEVTQAVTINLTQRAGSSGGGSMNWLIVLLLPVIFYRRFVMSNS